MHSNSIQTMWLYNLERKLLISTKELPKLTSKSVQLKDQRATTYLRKQGACKDHHIRQLYLTAQSIPISVERQITVLFILRPIYRAVCKIAEIKQNKPQTFSEA